MNYHRGKLIGTGGMSNVYEGVALEGASVPVGTVVALKYLQHQFLENNELVERFCQEVLTSYKLDSPNVTRGYDIENDNNVPVFVMELLYGETLRLRLQKQGAQDERTALLVALGIANGLSAAHAHNIVHRDIKPGNVHLGAHWPEAKGSVKLLDFGIAKIHNSTMTRVGARLGTPSYMSPEQISASSQVGPSSDLYSLGTLLYEMLTGSPPFTGNDMEIMGQHINAAPPELPAKISERTRYLYRRLLAKQVAQRPLNASHVATEIQMALHDLDKKVTITNVPTGGSSVHQSSSPVFDPPTVVQPHPVPPKQAAQKEIAEVEQQPKRNSPGLLLGLAGGGLLLLLVVAGLGSSGQKSGFSGEQNDSFMQPTSAPMSAVIIEPEPTATAVPTLIPEPTETPLPELTAIPTSAPVPTPEPTPEPTATPRPKPSPIPLGVTEETLQRPVRAGTTRRRTDSMLRGQSRVVSSPRDGVQSITYRVTRRGSKVISRVVISRRVDTEPVSGIIEIGTKRRPQPTPRPRPTKRPPTPPKPLPF